MKEHFSEVVDKLLLRAPPLFESTNKEDNHHYLTLFDDHMKGEDVLITPRIILMMGVKKRELPWTDLRLDANTQLINSLKCDARRYCRSLDSRRS